MQRCGAMNGLYGQMGCISPDVAHCYISAYTIFLGHLVIKIQMIDIELEISISKRSSGWAINYSGWVMGHIRCFLKYSLEPVSSESLRRLSISVPQCKKLRQGVVYFQVPYFTSETPKNFSRQIQIQTQWVQNLVE